MKQKPKPKKRANFLIHVEYISIMITIIGGYIMIQNRAESQIKETRDMIQKQVERSDKLYEMFIDLVKRK